MKSIITLLTLLLISTQSYASTPKLQTTSELRPFKVASLEFNPELHQRESNLERLFQAAEEAMQNGAELIVAPEMALTGYLYEDRKDIAPYVDTIPGIATNKLNALTQKYQSYLVFGLPEKDTNTNIYYNSAVLLGPEGVVGSYRKVHQWEAEEHWAAWGNLDFPVYETPLGNIAINICMDSGFFESSRIPALNGADIIAFPTNSSIQAIYYNQARALQNGVYVIGANRNTTEKDFHMVGMSGIWGPDGDKLAEAPFVSKSDSKAVDANTQIIYAEVDPTRYQTREKRMAGRRPELYQQLMLHVAPWNYKIDHQPKTVSAEIAQYSPTLVKNETQISATKSANLQKIKKLIENSKASDLLVLPEYTLTAEANSAALMKAMAEPMKGETYQAMSEIAKQRQINLVYSFVESDQGEFFVTSVVLGRDGNILGSYRKTHLSNSEKAWASAGDDIHVVDLPDVGRLGLLSGEDVLYPEAAGVLMGLRADIIAVTASWSGDWGTYVDVNQAAVTNPYPKHANVLWDAVAFSAQAYTLVANFVASENLYQGGSALYTLDPLYGLDQAQIAPQNEAKVLQVEFTTKQPNWWLNQNNMVTGRRTDYYTPLVEVN